MEINRATHRIWENSLEIVKTIGCLRNAPQFVGLRNFTETAECLDDFETIEERENKKGR